MKTLYDEDYFERGVETNKSLYTNYKWIPEFTIPFAFRIIEFLGIKKEDTILDFGCAKGFLVKALRLLGRDAYGYDISEYAIRNCPTDIKPFVSNKLRGRYDWVISKDTFEHIPKEDLKNVLEHLSNISNKIFVIVPLGDGEKYNAPPNDLDKTHIIKEPLGWWLSLFNDYFYVTYYSYKVKGMKENYYRWDKSHGFFILKSKYSRR